MGQVGFFTDTTLCIGCKACEVACKQWNQLPDDGFRLTGMSYDNTGHLGASTWRHVAFVERGGQLPGQGSPRDGADSPHAFGHIGFTNVVAYADRDREISVCLMNNGKPFITPGQLLWLNVARTIAERCRRH